jgi:catechol 2,3-dioxygenase-like lactoylglutathione lyase family enzyme
MPAIAATVAVSRLDVSARWYAATLGLHVVDERRDDPRPTIALADDGFRLDLLAVPAGWVIPRGAEPSAATARRAASTGLVQLAYLVPDVDAAVRRVGAFQAVAAESRLLHAPRIDRAWGVRFATVTDPDGGLVQIVERLAVPA